MTSEGSTEQLAISHHTALIDQMRINYRGVGTGAATVVLLHGFPQTGRSWERVAVQLGGLYRVIAPDLRGAGETSRPAGGFDKKTIAADIHSLIGSIGTERVHLVGHDIGGMVAYAYAAQWPDAVASLTMIDMLLPGFGIEAMYAIRQPGRFAHMPFFMTQDLPEWLVAGREEAFLDWFIRSALINQAAFSPEDILSYTRAYARPGGLRAAFDWFRAFWQDAEDNKAFARTKLTMPVLAVGGAQSVGGMLARSLQPLAENVRELVVDDCGHFIPDEQPELLARELAAFFSARG